jgi:3-hydroxymyristoyl/3-hydroxydecanoyl-(acyl carrier protein) dehydratase
MVRPGDVMLIEVTFRETLSKFHFMRGKVTVNGKLATTVDFALALLDS